MLRNLSAAFREALSRFLTQWLAPPPVLMPAELSRLLRAVEEAEGRNDTCAIGKARRALRAYRQDGLLTAASCNGFNHEVRN